MSSKPSHRSLDVIVLVIFATLANGAIGLDDLASRVQFQAGNQQTAQAGRGHRDLRAAGTVGIVSPAAIRTLRPFVEILDRLPHWPLDFSAGRVPCIQT